MSTFIIQGNTYPFRTILKDTFHATWNPTTKVWTVKTSLNPPQIKQTLSNHILQTLNIYSSETPNVHPELLALAREVQPFLHEL